MPAGGSKGATLLYDGTSVARFIKAAQTGKAELAPDRFN
jgi:hypothetical protein